MLPFLLENCLKFGLNIKAAFCPLFIQLKFGRNIKVPQISN